MDIIRSREMVRYLFENRLAGLDSELFAGLTSLEQL
jgi:hypothetical protein